MKIKLMSEFIFGQSNDKPPRWLAKILERVAKRHGATLVEAELPEGYRRWFTTTGYGHPFDAATAIAVARDLEKHATYREWMRGGGR